MEDRSLATVLETGLPDVLDDRFDLSILDDAALLDLARGGSTDSFAVLFERYRHTAYRLARYLSNAVDAKDIVAEAFAQVFNQIQQGRGPETSLRSYLFTSVRREAGRRAKMMRRVSPTDDIAVMDRSVPLFNGQADRFEREIVRAAFESLPERWRTVLWRMEVDGLKPHQLAPMLDMKPNAVSALAMRAREGLRKAYLHQHLASRDEHQIEPACADMRGRFAGFIRGSATTRDAYLVDLHLESCDACTDVFLELEEVNIHLGGVSSIAVLALAAPASGLVGDMIATAVTAAKSAVVAVGSTAAVLATSVTVTQIPTAPPAGATSIVQAEPHPAIQQEPDRVRNPAADKEPDAPERPARPAEATQVSGPEQGSRTEQAKETAGPTVVASRSSSPSQPVSVKVDQGGATASAKAAGAEVTVSVDLDEPKKTSVKVGKREIKVADVEKKTTGVVRKVTAARELTEEK